MTTLSLLALRTSALGLLARPSKDDRWRAAAQYSSVGATFLLNIELAAVLSIGQYGRFATTYGAVLLLVGLTDQGWNLLHTSHDFSLESSLGGKAASAAITVAVILLCARAGVIWAMAALAAPIGVGLITPVFTLLDAELTRRRDFAGDFATRLALAAAVSIVPVVIASVSKSPDYALAAVAASYLFGSCFAAWRLLAGRQVRPASKMRVSATHLLSAVGLQLPNNVVSNGLLTVAAVMAGPVTSAGVRLGLLVVGGVVACAPLGQLHMSVIEKDGPYAGASVRAQAAVVFVGAVALGSAVGIVPLLAIFGLAKYAPWALVAAGAALTGPLLVLGYFSIPAAVAKRDTYDTARKASVAAVLGAAIFALLTPHFGARALPMGLFSVGILLTVLLNGGRWPSRRSAVVAASFASVGTIVGLL